ncbi:hypothetical protein FS837_010958 [Tulasnella sp. UAMH 9824]|nr:hypothetical protein FS837_010958 [Tulasnella sp. UAMH 9824]
METSKGGNEPIAPAPSSGHPVQMGLDQDKDQDTTRVPTSNSTPAQASIHEVTPEPKTKKLSLEEKLGRLSEYRILESEIESTVETTGSGGKADVVRANFKRKEDACGEQVAVKMIRYTHTTKDEKLSKEFVHEVKLLARLSHGNIVRLIGFVEDLKNRKAWIVLSWEPNGNVREFLASGKWEIPERISLLNILVNSSCRAVITDFGSVRVLKNDDNRPANRQKVKNAGEVAAANEGDTCPEVTIVASTNQFTLTGPVRTLRWAAPELVMDGARSGLASDIWSAGWVCWEMMTNRVPFEDLKRDAAVMLKVIRGEVPLVREDTQVAQFIRLCSLMTDCWKYNPEDRPGVSQCCNEVRWMPSVPPLRETTSDSKELSHSLLLKMGRMHYLQDRPEKAAELFEKVVTNTESAVPQEVLAEALKYLGDVHRAQCKYAEAEESYTRAQEIYARIGDDQGRANTLHGLGNVYRLQCKYAEAEEFYTRAQEIYARIGNDQGRANTLLGFGHVYRPQIKYAEAEESYSRALEIYARIGGGLGRANTLCGLGHLRRTLGRRTDAAQFYATARDLYSQIGVTDRADNASYWLDTVRGGWIRRTWSTCRKSFSHNFSKLNIFPKGSI